MLAAALAATLLGVADTETVNGIEWHYVVEDGKVEIRNEDSYTAAITNTTTGALVVPSSLGGMPVTGIGFSAFEGCGSLMSVTIPSSVTSIGSFAFDGCGSLMSVTIPNSVTEIDDYAFYRCGGLTNVVIPVGVKSIGSSAFDNCSGLTSVTISDSVTSIGSGAFRGCSGLASNDLVIVHGILFDYVGTSGAVTIPNSVTEIGDYAFYRCSGLTNAVIPVGVKSIGASAFYNCSGLASVTIPNSVTSIGSGAFRGCSGLASNDLVIVHGILFDYVGTGGDVTIPNSVTSIGPSVFEGCSSLMSVTLPDGVTSIEKSAFKGCTNLVSVTIPNSVTNIGSSAFGGCQNLTDVTMPEYVCKRKLKTIFPSSYQSITNVVIQDGATSIGKSAFNGCKNLMSVTIPTSVTSIGDSAFYNCSGLKKIIFNGDSPNIRSSAFSKVAPDCTVQVSRNSVGWGVVIPGTWKGLRIEYAATTEPDATELWPSGVVGTVSMASSSVYDGYLYDRDGRIAGLITVQVGRPNARTKLAAVKATVFGLDGKRTNLKASGSGKLAISTEGPTGVVFKGKKCVVTLGAKGMLGYYRDYHIDGSLNVFMSRDAADKAVASTVLGKWQGAVNVAWQGAQGWNGLSVTIAAKGKAKVRGTLANGVKVSATGQLTVGEEWCCVPVVCAKMVLAFNVWLPKVQGEGALPTVVGIARAVVGKPGTLKDGAKFNLDAVLGDAKYATYLPDGVAVGGDAKWTLPTAGKVQLTREGQVDEAKLGENPSALKLTYKASDGSFKGSFKTYADLNGRPKAANVKVVGVLVNGVGYGTAAGKGASAPVTVE